MKKRIVYFFPAIIWTIIIFLLTLLPGKDIPSNTFLSNIPQFDKVVHASLFFGFVITWSFGYYLNNISNRYINIVIKYTLLAIALGISIEFVQLWWKAIHRDFEILDMVADTIGALTGAWVSRKFLPKWLSKKSKLK